MLKKPCADALVTPSNNATIINENIFFIALDIESEKLRENPGVEVYNLGTGNGYSVLQVVAAFEKACGHAIPYEIKPRREGDIATCYCDPQKAKEDLGWEAKYGIEEMCEDSWRWQSTNPDGYASK